MKAAQILKTKINGNGITTGILVSFHLWLELVEICINAGLDYMIVDLEHGAHPESIVAEVCALGRLMDFPILIRPQANDFDTIRKTVDLGPCGLMLAMVNNTQILDEARDALYMPPRGKRRPGGPGNRWINDFNYQTWRDEVEADFIVLPQIESRVGLENAAAIARHEIVTAIAVGPYDLSADLGVCWQPESPVLLEALAQIRQAGQAVGKNMWMIGDGPTNLRKGFTFLCIAEPIGLLEGALKTAVTGLRAGVAGDSGYEFGESPVR